MSERQDQPPPTSSRSWAELLKNDWNMRGQSESRDFFIASHLGWRDPEARRRQAVADVNLLVTDLPEAWLAAAAVLEVGCGVGRLATVFSEIVSSYTGFDIAPSMVEEAKERCRDRTNCRFFESDGTGVPASAKDRRYDLAFSHAVLVHCPKSVVETLARETLAVLDEGGRFRFQLRADMADPTGIEAPPAIAAVALVESQAVEESAEPTDLALIDEHYMGHAFGFDEARELFSRLGGTLELRRFDPCFIYGDLARD